MLKAEGGLMPLINSEREITANEVYQSDVA